MYHLPYTYVAASGIVPTLVRQMLHYQAGVYHDYVVVSRSSTSSSRRRYVRNRSVCYRPLLARTTYLSVCLSLSREMPLCSLFSILSLYSSQRERFIYSCGYVQRRQVQLLVSPYLYSLYGIYGLVCVILYTLYGMITSVRTISHYVLLILVERTKRSDAVAVPPASP